MDIKFILLVIGLFIFTLGYVNQNKYNCIIFTCLFHILGYHIPRSHSQIQVPYINVLLVGTPQNITRSHSQIQVPYINILLVGTPQNITPAFAFALGTLFMCLLLIMIIMFRSCIAHITL